MLEVDTRIQVVLFCFRRFVYPILSKHKICLNFMIKICKTSILYLRNNVDLKPFLNPSPALSLRLFKIWIV